MKADMEKVIKGLTIERECIQRNWDGKCDRKCDKCDIVQNTEYLLKVYDSAIELLKEQENASKRNPVIVCPHCGKRVV